MLFTALSFSIIVLRFFFLPFFRLSLLLARLLSFYTLIHDQSNAVSIEWVSSLIKSILCLLRVLIVSWFLILVGSIFFFLTFSFNQNRFGRRRWGRRRRRRWIEKKMIVQRQGNEDCWWNTIAKQLPINEHVTLALALAHIDIHIAGRLDSCEIDSCNQLDLADSPFSILCNEKEHNNAFDWYIYTRAKRRLWNCTCAYKK